MQHGDDDDCIVSSPHCGQIDLYKDRDAVTHICSMVLIMIVLFQVVIVDR